MAGPKPAALPLGDAPIPGTFIILIAEISLSIFFLQYLLPILQDTTNAILTFETGFFLLQKQFQPYLLRAFQKLLKPKFRFQNVRCQIQQFCCQVRYGILNLRLQTHPLHLTDMASGRLTYLTNSFSFDFVSPSRLISSSVVPPSARSRFV